MKAVLVLDNFPRGCLNCPLCMRINNLGPYCTALQEEALIDTYDSRCPLREEPERADYESFVGAKHPEFADGWNACLDAILREED